jgi:hypothetical protein
VIAISQIEKPDVIAISETLPKTNQTLDKLQKYDLEGYTSYHTTTGRGVSIYIRDHYKSDTVSFEIRYEDNTWVLVDLPNHTNALVGCIYRSPNSPEENNAKLLTLLTQATLIKANYLVIVGDFNYKEIDWKSKQVHTRESHPAYQIYNKINDLFLDQLITSPTRHREGERPNVLDWVITNSSDKISDIQISAPLGEKGDHNVITFALEIPRKGYSIPTAAYSYTRGDYDTIRENLSNVNWETLFSNTGINENWNAFLSLLQKEITNNIPQVKLKSNKYQPWVNSEVKNARKEKQKAWRKYSRQKNQENWVSFTQKRNLCNRIIRNNKYKFESDLAQSISKNPKAFWNYVNSKKGNIKDFPLMTDEEGVQYETDLDKANQFNVYFCNVFTEENPDPPMLDNKAPQ